METFGDWLALELQHRGWTQAELSRRARIRPGSLSRIMNGLRNVGPDMAGAIARALGMPPEDVLRRAGLLPAVPEDTAETTEASRIIGRLPEATRRVVMAMLRGLERTVPPVAFDDPWKQALLEEAEAMGDAETAVRWLRERRELTGRPVVHIIGESEEDAAAPPPPANA